MENEKNQAIMTVVVTAADFLMSPNRRNTRKVMTAVKIIVKAKIDAVIAKIPQPFKRRNYYLDIINL